MSATDPRQPTKDVVTQSEVEALLAQIGGAASEAPNPAATRLDPIRSPDPEACQAHAFPQLSYFSAGDLRKLRVRHEEFTRSLAARISISHRVDLALQMSKLEMMASQRFLDGMTHPTCLFMLKLEPLPGVCLLEIPSSLGLWIVDRELGGPATSMEEARELTEVEERLLSRFVETLISEWCGFWSDMLDLRPVVVGHENSGRFVQTTAPETTMLVLGLEARCGEAADQIQLGFPYYTLEPLIAKLNEGSQSREQPKEAKAAAKLRWNPVMNDVKVRVAVRLPEFQLSARQLSHLKLGDVLPVKCDASKEIRVYLEQKAKFEASLGTVEQRWAVKLCKRAVAV